MAGKTLDLRNIITPDQLGTQIARTWVEWNTLRQFKVQDWNEVRKYVYATDTTTTTNNKLPWKNKTTTPKLCQIRDNLHANYKATLFPKRKWLKWEADDKDSNSVDKRDAIQNYMSYVISQAHFKEEVSKLILDYIDQGNCFAMPEWIDNTQTLPDGKTKVGYVGPGIRRISPLDIVFNPTAPNFESSPKIVRSMVSLGELKEMMEKQSENGGTGDDQAEGYQNLFEYLLDIRAQVRTPALDLLVQDEWYRVDGFTSYRQYLESDYAEVLSFYGDIYDIHENTFFKNVCIMVVDRHKIIMNKPNPSFFGYPPIFHCGWRPRQDNLWAMGPLDNLVGMQYRIDHIENLKADVFDLIAFPPLKIKGYVEDFQWGPMSKIFVGDEGDVNMMAPPWNVLQANEEIVRLQQQMEELAGAPKEAMGFRSPGEKTAYEVQTMQNAASRIFINKTTQFEELFMEKLLNAQLELARRNLPAVMSIPVFNSDLNITSFTTLTPIDVTGSGRIKPIAARHFAERSETVQNLTSFFSSQVGMDQEIKEHWSTIGISKLFEELLDLQDYGLVQPYVRLAERADAQRLINAHTQQVSQESQTPSGMTPGDHDMTSMPQQIPTGGGQAGPPVGLPQGALPPGPLSPSLMQGGGIGARR